MVLDDLKERYESFIGSLKDKGVPMPEVLVPIIVLLLVGALAMLAFPNLLAPAAEKKTLSFSVKDQSGKSVPGARVALYVDGSAFDNAYSDTSGLVSFAGVPATSQLAVNVDATGFESLSKQSISISTPEVTLTSSAPAATDVTIKVKDADGNDVEGANVMLMLDDGNARTKITDYFGEAVIRLEGALPDHATLSVDKEGFAKKQASVYSAQLQQMIIVEVAPSQDAAKTGPALVSVKSTEGDVLSGILVTLFDSATSAVIKSARTDASGNALFEDMAYGTSFTISAKDPTDGYVAYSGTESYSFDKTSSAPLAVVRMERATDGGNFLSVAVTDADGSRLEGAFVTVYDRSTKVQLAQEQTDALGSARVALAKNKAFYVTAYKDGCLPSYDDQLRAGDSKAFVLEKESAGNYVDVLVTVTQAQQPAPNAYVSLFRGEGFPLGVPTWGTASDGTAYVRVPKQLNGKSYKIYATATLDNADGKSDIVDVKEGAQLFVVMQYPPAFFSIEPRDVATNVSIVNALVSLNAGGKTIATCTSNGSACVFAVAPNEEFTFKASVKGYLNAETASITLNPGERAYAPLYMYPTAIAKDVSLRFEGLFDAKGDAVKEVSNGDSYYARFLATVPSSDFNATNVFIKVGDKQTVGEEIAAIQSFDSSISDTVYSGSSFDSSNCLAQGNETSSMLKWVQFVLPEGFVGTKEIELKIAVSPEAKSNDSVKIFSSMHGFRGGVPFTVPTDSALINSLLPKAYITDADFCGAKTNKDEIAVTKEPMLCSGSVCVRLYFDVDGKIYRDAPEIELGKTFKLYYDVLAIDATANRLTLGTGTNVEIVSWQVAGGASMAAADTAKERSVQVSIAPGERASGVITLRALRASDYEPFQFTINFADSGVEPAVLQSYAKITGTNAFKVLIKPTELVAGLSENVKVTVLDRLDVPVTDATVTFFDCDGAPLNGEELALVGENARNLGADGKYAAKLQSASIGIIGVRVQNPAFQTYEECAITSLAGDFVQVQPETLAIEGSSADVRATTKQVIVNTLLPVRSSVSADVVCADAAGNATAADMAGLIYTSPQSFTLTPDSEVPVEVYVKTNATATANCIITFTAKLSPKQKATATVAVKVTVQGPPPAACVKPYACLADAEAIARDCAYVPSMKCSNSMKCFECDVGPQTLPSQIDFAVSNTKPSDTQGFLISLDTPPEECRVEGFDAPVTSLTSQQYQQNYGTTPQSYYGYQQNQYQPQSNVWSSYSPYSTQSYYNAYGALSSQSGVTAGASAYGQGYGASLSYGTAANCPTSVNSQTLASGYGSAQYQSPWSMYGTGTSGYGTTGTSAYGTNAYSSYGMSMYCQYPYICQNPQLCSYSASGYGSSMYLSGGASYQQLCQQQTQNTIAPQTSSSTPPVKVTIESCTASELQITAKYTGADYFYNGGLGGTQEGFLVIKTGPGQLKRVPIRVTVQTPLVSTAQALGAQPAQYSPFPLMGGTMPSNCMFPQLQAQAGTEDLDQYGLPDEITIKYNPVSGKGRYERELPSMNGLSVLCKAPKDTKAKVSCSGTKITATYDCKITGKDSSCGDDSGTIEMYRAGMQKPKSVSVTVEEDDFRPAVIQMLRSTEIADKGENDKGVTFDVDLTDAKVTSNNKCAKITWKKGTLTASAEKGGECTGGILKISNYGSDYQMREIPVVASAGRILEANPSNAYVWNLQAEPSCSGVSGVTCTKTEFKVDAKAGSGKEQVQPGGEYGPREKPIEITINGDWKPNPDNPNEEINTLTHEKRVKETPITPPASGSKCKLEKSVATDKPPTEGTCGSAPSDSTIEYYKLVGPMAAGECGLMVGDKWAYSGTCKDACASGESTVELDSKGYLPKPCTVATKKCCIASANYDHVQSNLAWKYVTTVGYAACGSGEYCVAAAVAPAVGDKVKNLKAIISETLVKVTYEYTTANEPTNKLLISRNSQGYCLIDDVKTYPNYADLTITNPDGTHTPGTGPSISFSRTCGGKVVDVGDEIALYDSENQKLASYIVPQGIPAGSPVPPSCLIDNTAHKVTIFLTPEMANNYRNGYKDLDRKGILRLENAAFFEAKVLVIAFKLKCDNNHACINSKGYRSNRVDSSDWETEVMSTYMGIYNSLIQNKIEKLYEGKWYLTGAFNIGMEKEILRVDPEMGVTATLNPVADEASMKCKII
ncbi:Carboxypeptidase regulatory-like domain protein [Candidatus Norongarragalina meridionalis]|nr:Carboxypeptidase regulatory-like domain protein [Candidatus Norongarragalina meridionalis]